jgi:phosphinothricin acetyltransferase
MVRLAVPEDLERIVYIYNQAIVAGFQTCFTRPFEPAERLAWFERHDGANYPLFVFERSGVVAGWLSVSPYREGRQALNGAVELSYFIDNAHLMQGIGSQLMRQAITFCWHRGYKTALAILLDTNTASVKLLEKFGFGRWGHLPGIADFNGLVCGQYYYGLSLDK